METEKTNLDYVYMHINNGGINLKIDKKEYTFNDGKKKAYPVLVIESEHFGIQTNQIKIPMTPDRMRQVAEWLAFTSQEVNDWYENEEEGEDSYDGLFIKLDRMFRN